MIYDQPSNDPVLFRPQRGHKYSLSKRPASLNRQLGQKDTYGLKTQLIYTYLQFIVKQILVGGPLQGSVLLKGRSDILPT